MKVLNAAQMHQLDAYTQEIEHISSLQLMERAATVFVDYFIQEISAEQEIWIFCGKGNNGGDGLAIARLLILKGFTVNIFLLKVGLLSNDCTANVKTLIPLIAVNDIGKEDDIPAIPNNVVIVDALLGSGLNKEVTGIYARLIDAINTSHATVYSVDVPSGMYCDYPAKHTSIIKADYTLTFHTPKLMFFLSDNESYTGAWHVLDIGLKEEGTEHVVTNYFYTTDSDIRLLMHKRSVFSNKGTFGKALLIVGSRGMMGAAALSSKACMRSGVGLVCAHIPACGVDILQTLLPEAVLSIDVQETVVSQLPDVKVYSAIGVGSGIGEHALTVIALQKLLEDVDAPMVIDASALNILASHPELMKHIPANSILTPHPKELERLAGITFENSWERLLKGIELAKAMQVIIVLKGAYSAVIMPTGVVHFNSTGNSGMATAGSGDVLTGIVTSLLAQGYSPEDAAKIGVFAHGYAGDAAAKKISKSAMIASDIVDHLSDFFLAFE
jgi:hydroxyethylthiazole kinase-like uncharacterized protein yjeF